MLGRMGQRRGENRRGTELGAENALTPMHADRLQGWVEFSSAY